MRKIREVLRLKVEVDLSAPRSRSACKWGESPSVTTSIALRPAG